MSSNAYRSPIVRKIVLDVVKRLKEGGTHIDVTYTLNTDLVPKVSERMFTQHHVQRSTFIQTRPQPTPTPTKMEKSLVLNTKIEPHAAPQTVYSLNAKTQSSQNISAPLKPRGPQTVFELPELAAPKIEPMPSLANVQLNELYHGKIAGLLNDPSVMSIECTGQNVPLNIYRGGQKQRTKILLTKMEIDRLLKEISQQSKIPLGEGVFRVIVNNLMINAVISELVGTRFVIKKLFSMNNQQRH